MQLDGGRREELKRRKSKVYLERQRTHARESCVLGRRWRARGGYARGQGCTRGERRSPHRGKLLQKVIREEARGEGAYLMKMKCVVADQCSCKLSSLNIMLRENLEGESSG